MLTKLFEPSWAEAMEPYIDKVNLSDVGSRIAFLRNNGTIYPERHEVFKAFNLTPFNKLKVVILGQDPYHDGSADGLAFSNSKTTHSSQVSPSLRLILTEVIRSYPEVKRDISEGRLDLVDLSRWSVQGVLLLNTALTVEKGSPGTHFSLWITFIKGVVNTIQSKNDIVWLLMGKEAKSFKSLIVNPSHQVVESIHPAAQLYNPQNKFVGTDVFKTVNEALLTINKSEIKW